MSSALLWECVRDNHAYLRRGQGRALLSAEPGNLANIHNFKYSGLAAKKTAGLTVELNGKKEQITFTRKTSPKKESKPSKFRRSGKMMPTSYRIRILMQDG